MAAMGTLLRRPQVWQCVRMMTPFDSRRLWRIFPFWCDMASLRRTRKGEYRCSTKKINRNNLILCLLSTGC